MHFVISSTPQLSAEEGSRKRQAPHVLGKTHLFFNSEILGIQIWREKRVNYDQFKIATRQRKSNIQPKCITLNYHVIYIVLTNFASFTGYEDGILEVISNMHIKESKFGGKIDKFGRKSF